MSTSVSAAVNTITVAEALTKVTTDAEFLKFVSENQAFFVTFGSKNSHTLRHTLFGLYKKANLSKKAIFLVHFFHAVISDPGRVLAGISTLPKDMQEDEAIKDATAFIKKYLVKLVRDEKGGKFASVRLGNTMPGLDMFCAAMIGEAPKDESVLRREVTALVGRKTFAQLKVNDALLALNKTAQKDYWDNTVKIRNADERKKSTGKGFEVGFQEEYWATNAADDYLLVDKDADNNFVEVPVATVYTMDDILAWYGRVHGKEVVIKNGAVTEIKDAGKGKTKVTTTGGTSGKALKDMTKAEIEAEIVERELALAEAEADTNEGTLKTANVTAKKKAVDQAKRFLAVKK